MTDSGKLKWKTWEKTAAAYIDHLVFNSYNSRFA